ncbi:MAG TPA: hypothetical protein VJ385_15230 [Fibrobacteria bacterium]|nr:hypothetical protein [Fibrobacteria bacterium]
MSRTFSIADNRVRTLRILNKRNNATALAMPSDEFRLRLSQGAQVDSTDFILKASDFTLVSWTIKNGTSGSKTLAFTLNNAAHKLQVVMNVELSPTRFFMQKYLEITRQDPITLEFAEVDVVKLPGALQPYTLSSLTTHNAGDGGTPDAWKPPLGQPLYTDPSGLFFGVEFAASVNRVNAGELSSAYLWGRDLPARTYRTYSAVCGAAKDSRYVRKSFLEYIDSIRIRPLHLQTQYNSWFEYQTSVTKAKFAASVQTISTQLFQNRGTTPFKVFTIDDGWQNSGSFWKANTSKFDADFATTRGDAQSVGSNLGLWLSPMGGFGSRATQVGYLKSQNYEAVNTMMCIAGPKYMDELQKRMLELVGQGVRYFKLDGIFGHLNDREFCPYGQQHGHPYHPNFILNRANPDDPKWDEMKIYYLTAGMEKFNAMLQALHAANPNVYVLASNGAWLSPWWLMNVDAVWMIDAGDGSRGTTRTPQIVYRDGRYYGLYVRDKAQFPQASMFNHEPEKAATDASLTDFKRYLYMQASRGSGLFEWYMKPGVITSEEWDAIAANIKWVQDNFGILRHAEYHGGDPTQGKVYGYTAWTFSDGIVSMHNPGTAPQSYSFVLDQSMGVYPGSGPFTVTSPINAVAQPGPYAYGSTINVTLPAQEIFVWKFSGSQGAKGCPDSGDPGYNPKAGVEDLSLCRPAVTVAPQPAPAPGLKVLAGNASFRFSASVPYALSLRDPAGREILRQDGYGSHVAFLSERIPNGLYALTLRYGSGLGFVFRDRVTLVR